MIILFSPYLPSHDQDDYALCWVFKKNTICMCIMTLLEGACHLLTSGSIEYPRHPRRGDHLVCGPGQLRTKPLICSKMLQTRKFY